ncbi:hypothetical protein E2562_038852 [Oryza meyeriana var. granulata]|uniref:Uncharacterized protein n=1 Tax=Oryza meyeriana var. granulata TaxID=110450 RepID=A0A6G1DTF2_9ORYZ|nr:hypothetical protein E2562_038852 [Oryza meyeriana var. granulata]
MVAWPLYAEQRMNTAMLSSWVGIDMPPSNTREEDGVVTREEVAVVVREPISGEKGRCGAEEGARLREAAAKATQAPGSPSHEAFEAVVAGVTGGSGRRRSRKGGSTALGHGSGGDRREWPIALRKGERRR